jgi:cysteine desulfurase
VHRYLDYNATCPATDEAVQAVAETSKNSLGNPSSLHWAGRAARKILDDSRDELAKYIHTEAGSIVFTSGGTEANNMAIHGWLATQESGKIVVSSIEHPSVLQPLEKWSKKSGWEVICIRPGKDGVVDVDTFCSHIDTDTRLVCLMMANNETGTVQPVAEIANYCREHGVAMLVDAVQALGKMSLDVGKLDVDFVSLSAHKIGGPKGVGALVMKRGRKPEAYLQGGGQERKRRSGTENVPGAAGFAASLGVVDFSACEKVRDGFEASLQASLPDAVIFGGESERLGNTSMFSMPGLDGETLLMQLDLAGFAVASGSACSSGKRDASHVLLAMGISEQQARSSIRVSFGPGHSVEDAEALVGALANIRKRLKMMAGAR